MHFTTAALLACLSATASLVSAYQPSFYAGDGYPSSRNMAILKREAYAAAYADVYNNLYAREAEAYAYADADAEADADAHFSYGLSERNNDKVVLEYLRNIDTRTATGSFNKDMWTRVHGDSKSSVGGNLHIETGIFGGHNQARLLQSGVKGSGANLATVDVPRPQVGCAIHRLRVKFGGPKPPTGC